jgi:HlyD family secretion protein
MLRKLNLIFILTFTCLFLSRCTDSPEIPTVAAGKSDLEVTVSTNGIIEPTDSVGIYAPVSGFVKTIDCSEGSAVERGRILMQLDASQARLSLAEARASLLQARRQARIVLNGPPKEELDSLEAAIKETRLQLRQVENDLSTEESLYRKGAASREAVERLQKRKELLEVQLDAQSLNKDNLLERYSEEEKAWEQDKLSALADQVKLLEGQVRDASISSSESGILYSLSVKPGSFVNQGQILAQIYQPGEVRLRAYVDEPDLGRIHKGQRITLEWDGMPDEQWNGVVEILAERVVALNNRSVGHVLCTIDGKPGELIPGINVKVLITTDVKNDALVVPRSAVFNHEGKSAVLLPEGKGTVIQPVEIGLATNSLFEILAGIDAGDAIVVNPREVLVVE